MNWINETYKKNLERFTRIDGLKAIILYVLIMGSCFFQGWLYTTNLDVAILSSSQIWIALILIIIGMTYIVVSKEGLFSIGITTKNIGKSILLGIIGGIILLVARVVVCKMQGVDIFLSKPMMMSWLLFIICAYEEEILFRGYIQTRLAGLIKKQWVASAIIAIFFLLIHYPVRWVATGNISLLDLSVQYIIALLVLHYFCDIVYKKTNCLWGSIVLHIIYNAVGAMIVF